MASRNPVSYYEYIRIKCDAGDLSELNALSETGWRVICTIENGDYLLLERKLAFDNHAANC